MHTTSFLEDLVFTDPLSDLCLFAAITSQWSEYKLVIVTGILMPLRKFNLFPDLGVEAAHPRHEGAGPRLLHVPDQHGANEAKGRLYRRQRVP